MINRDSYVVRSVLFVLKFDLIIPQCHVVLHILSVFSRTIIYFMVSYLFFFVHAQDSTSIKCAVV